MRLFKLIDAEKAYYPRDAQPPPQLEQLRRDLEEVQKLHREALEEIRRLNRGLADTKNSRGWKIANGINAAIIKARSIFKRDDPSTPPK